MKARILKRQTLSNTAVWIAFVCELHPLGSLKIGSAGEISTEWLRLCLHALQIWISQQGSYVLFAHNGIRTKEINQVSVTNVIILEIYHWSTGEYHNFRSLFTYIINTLYDWHGDWGIHLRVGCAECNLSSDASAGVLTTDCSSPSQSVSVAGTELVSSNLIFK